MASLDSKLNYQKPIYDAELKTNKLQTNHMNSIYMQDISDSLNFKLD